MNLKKQYNVVVDYRKVGGVRKLVSVNKLADYVGNDRANFILNNVAKCMSFPKRYSANKGITATFYLK